MAKKTKVCVGCCDRFLTFKNYDYCPDRAVNNNRYLTKSNCSECDGSGMIKFPGQKPRPCKLCYLTTMNKSKKLTAEEIQAQKKEQFWDQVDLLAQEKIHQLLTKTIPLPNLKLITETYRFEDKQEKLTGLFLHKDADYRTLLLEIPEQYSSLPKQEYLAEDIALWYCRMVIKSLIADLSNYSNYENHFFANLTPEN